MVSNRRYLEQGARVGTRTTLIRAIWGAAEVFPFPPHISNPA